VAANNAAIVLVENISLLIAAAAVHIFRTKSKRASLTDELAHRRIFSFLSWGKDNETLIALFGSSHAKNLFVKNHF
jgi:hypothetical protein